MLNWLVHFHSQLRDYSAFYHIHLVPCTVSSGQTYSLPLNCDPHDPITFQLPITFQQTSDPVSSEYTLNTNFHILNKRSLWLSESPIAAVGNSDSTFLPGLYFLYNINKYTLCVCFLSDY